MNRFFSARYTEYYLAPIGFIVFFFLYAVFSAPSIGHASSMTVDPSTDQLEYALPGTPGRIANRPPRRSTVATPQWQDRISGDRKSELRCLALNVYFEARSEPRIGMFAVAAVTLNRVAHPRFPNSVCKVVWQGEKLGQHRCQFSWACDGRSDRPRDSRAWKSAQEIAHMMLTYGLADPTAGALWYHADYVEPRWARHMTVVARIGRHVYYRQPLTVERHDLDAS